MISAASAGFLTSLSLILAIGAQNAFVLRQGLRREYITPIVAICALSDALLIAIGVGGFNRLGPILPMLTEIWLTEIWLTEIIRWAGVAFLLVYGALRFRAALRGGEKLLPANTPPAALSHIIGTCLLITWANPHVYLDTVMLLGSISAQYHPDELIFAIGAALGSFTFFATLGYGARLLAPILANMRAWIILEALIGLTMWMIALGLILKA